MTAVPLTEASALLETRDLTKHFGGIPATDSLNLSVSENTVHALIGPNGAGKSTTVAQICGTLRPDFGQVLFRGQDITALPVHRRTALGLGRSFQITSLFPEFSARENVALALIGREGKTWSLQRPVKADNDLQDRAEALLERVGLAGFGESPAHTLAHGQKRALELAMALAGAPRLLLLDEPMAGMGPEESRRMVDLLGGLKGSVTILLVEHDMDAVFALADRITVLVNGRALADGTPDQVRSDPEVRAAYLGETET